MKKHILYTFSACLIISFIFLLTENAFSQDTPKYATGITSGRARALIGGAVGLTCLITGWRAKVLAAKGINTHTSAIVSLILGVIGIMLSLVHLSTSAGAVFGSGSGKAGAIVALILGLIGITFASLALKKGNERGTNGN